MKYALMANCDPESDRYEQIGPYIFVRELFDAMPEFHDDLVRDIREVDDSVQQNMIYNPDDGTFSDPPPPPPPETAMMVSAAFLHNLTGDEYVALAVRAQDALRDPKPDATLQRFLDLMRLELVVKLDDDLTKSAKETMVKANILTQARADELFKP